MNTLHHCTIKCETNVVFSPGRSPQFPARWQKFPFVQRYDAHGCLHDCNELFKLHVFNLLSTASHAEHGSNCCYIPMARFVEKCKITCTYTAFAHLLLHNRALLATSECQLLHDAGPQHQPPEWCGPVPWLLRLLSTKEDSNRCPFGFSAGGGNKTDRHVSARRWAGCEGDDGTSLLHNSGASLNIIVMKMQSLPSPIPPLLG